MPRFLMEKRVWLFWKYPMGLVRFYVLIVLLAPLFWGAVYPWTTALWLLALAFIAMRMPGAWLQGPKFVEFSLYGIVLAFVLVVILQVLPDALSLAPNSIWGLVSEVFDRNIPARAATDLSALIWELGPAALYALALWIALGVGGDHHRASAFLQWTILGTAMLTGVTLMLFFADMHVLIWEKGKYSAEIFTHGFINRNNAAAYLGAFMLLSFGMLVRSIKNLHLTSRWLSPDSIDEFLPDLIRKVMPYSVALAVFSVGLFLTISRAGIILAGISLVFLMSVLLLKSKSGLLSRTLGIVVIIAASAWIIGNWSDMLSQRIDRQGLELQNRAEVYSATGRMIMDYPVLGVGLGGFAGTFPAYRPQALGPMGVYDKAHNTYLEIAAEMGAPFAILLAAFWIGLFATLVRGIVTRRRRYFFPAIGASVWLYASLHSLVDFPLQIPGHALVVGAVLGVCAAQSIHRRHRRT